MSFANALNILRPTLPYYLALTKYGLLRITKDCFEFEPNPAAPPIALEMARAVFTMGASSCTESYVMSRTDGMCRGSRRRARRPVPPSQGGGGKLDTGRPSGATLPGRRAGVPGRLTRRRRASMSAKTTRNRREGIALLVSAFHAANITARRTLVLSGR
jgi:hypothetical protein